MRATKRLHEPRRAVRKPGISLRWPCCRRGSCSPPDSIRVRTCRTAGTNAGPARPLTRVFLQLLHLLRRFRNRRHFGGTHERCRTLNALASLAVGDGVKKVDLRAAGRGTGAVGQVRERRQRCCALPSCIHFQKVRPKLHPACRTMQAGTPCMPCPAGSEANSAGQHPHACQHAGRPPTCCVWRPLRLGGSARALSALPPLSPPAAAARSARCIATVMDCKRFSMACGGAGQVGRACSGCPTAGPAAATASLPPPRLRLAHAASSPMERAPAGARKGAPQQAPGHVSCAPRACLGRAGQRGTKPSALALQKVQGLAAGAKRRAPRPGPAREPLAGPSWQAARPAQQGWKWGTTGPAGL